MTIYERELQLLKTHDEVQCTKSCTYNPKYNFIITAGHGYLIVPADDENFEFARGIAEYGYRGNLAIYLEEDCEAGQFLTQIKK